MQKEPERLPGVKDIKLKLQRLIQEKQTFNLGINHSISF